MANFWTIEPHEEKSISNFSNAVLKALENVSLIASMLMIC